MVSAALEFIAGFITNANPATLLAAAGILGANLVKSLINTVIAPIAKQLVEKIVEKIATALMSFGLPLP